MKKLKTVFLLCLVSFLSFGQGVQIVYQNKDYKPKEKLDNFHYIIKEMDVSASLKVATLKGYSTSSGNQTLAELFNDFWKTANKLGANAFKTDTIEIKSDKLVCVTITAYYLTDAEIDKNFGYYPKNMIYIYGSINKNGTNRNFKLNNVKICLAPFEYVAYQNKVGQDAVISIGGISGAKTWIYGKDGRLPEHLSLSNFGVGPSFYPGPGMGITINTGRIYPVELSFGQFLLGLLTEKTQ